MGDLIPKPIGKRTDKMGFVTPEHVWFAGELKSWADDIINSSFKSRKYFNFPQIQRTIEDYRSRKKDIGFALWRWVNLELWLRSIEMVGA